MRKSAGLILGCLMVTAIWFSALPYNDPPILRELVDTGQLPPVEERLPENPMVVPVVERIGDYGGTWHRVATGKADLDGALQRILTERFFQYDTNMNLLPNLLADYEFTVTENETVFRGYLRRRVRWSDGFPFTVEDVIFVYNDVLRYDPERGLVDPPSWLMCNGKPAEIVAIDNWTFEIRFAGPKPLFLKQLTNAAPGYGIVFVNNPKHYLAQFHPKYNPKPGLTAQQQWNEFQALNERNGYAPYYDPARPVLFPWKPEIWEPDKRLVLVRNPYYWKVDEEGNQLPYIDRIENEIVDSLTTVTLKALNGEIDMQARHMNFADYPVLVENSAVGDYRVYLWQEASTAYPAIFFNQTCPNPVIRELITNLDFRLALSLGINREEINETLWMGQAMPYQHTVHPLSEWYVPGIGQYGTEYDPELANRILDEIGLKRGPDGKRLGPDGKPIVLTVDVPTGYGVNFIETLELVRDYWADLGITLNINAIERGLLFSRTRSGEQELVAFNADKMVLPLVDLKLIPTRSMVFFGSQIGDWYQSGGSKGVAPEGEAAELLSLWNKIQADPDLLKRREMIRNLIVRSTAQLWGIGTVGMVPIPVVIKNNFHNVPDIPVLWDHPLLTPKNTFPEQYFIEGS